MEELKLESALPQLLDLKMSLEDGIENANKLTKQYNALIEVINKATDEEKKDFPEHFVDSLLKEVEILKIKKEDCEERLTYVRIMLDEVQDKTEKGQKVLELASLIYGALGILAGQQEKYQSAINNVQFGDTKEETK